jgi:hypothetical protein
MRPYSEDKPVSKETLTNADVFRMQGEMKDKLKHMF